MASWYFRDVVRSRDDQKRQEQARRRRGYEDGYANRPATSTEIVYAVAWRRGQEARRAEGEMP